MQKGGSSWGVSLERWDDCRHCGVSGPSEKLLVVQTAVCDLCTVPVEKRIREEQSWQLQKTFQDSLFRFQDWLWAAEGMAACPNSSQVSYACSKKELQKFEGLQRQIADKLLPLETLNRQYHQLARNGHSGPQLRSTIQEINQRWDALKIRTASIYKRLKHFVIQREEFELERETIRIWLMELDLRLTDVEHFSGGTSLEKMIQLQAFRQDIQVNAERVDHLLVRGELLIQKSQPEDAEILEEELRDLSSFCQEVFRRVFCFRWRLVSIRLVFENEWLSDQDSDVESDCFTDSSLEVAVDGETILPLPPSEPGSQSTPKRTSRHHQQVDPNLGGIMDLEWDPSVDVGGSTSHEEEDSSYYSTITGVEPWEEPNPRSRSFPQEPLYPLPSPCGSPEDSLGDAWPSAFQEQREHLRSPLPDEESQTCSSDKFCLWGLEGFQHPQNLPLEKGAGCQIEPMGFDPKRIESWLGQSCQEKTEGQGTGPLPASEWHFSGRSQTSKRRAEKIKSQQHFRRKARAPLRDGAKTGQPEEMDRLLHSTRSRRRGRATSIRQCLQPSPEAPQNFRPAPQDAALRLCPSAPALGSQRLPAGPARTLLPAGQQLHQLFPPGPQVHQWTPSHLARVPAVGFPGTGELEAFLGVSECGCASNMDPCSPTVRGCLFTREVPFRAMHSQPCSCPSQISLTLNARPSSCGHELQRTMNYIWTNLAACMPFRGWSIPGIQLRPSSCLKLCRTLVKMLCFTASCAIYLLSLIF